MPHHFEEIAGDSALKQLRLGSDQELKMIKSFLFITIFLTTFALFGQNEPIPDGPVSREIPAPLSPTSNPLPSDQRGDFESHKQYQQKKKADQDMLPRQKDKGFKKNPHPMKEPKSPPPETPPQANPSQKQTSPTNY